jgi:hypothetical protein
MSGVPVSGPTFPSVRGYAEGQQVLFFHSEASDPQIAQTLSGMTSSRVLVVPELAQVPQSELANVYVFSNGIQGGGPLGFQPDVFDNPPYADGYRPLRSLNLVTWSSGASPHELKSASELQAAEASGELTIQQPGVVIDMPMLTWPGGQR